MHASKEDKLDNPAWDSFSSVKLFDEMKHNEQLEEEKQENNKFSHIF